jgi:ATP-dependent DNA helicase RecG
MEIIDLIETLSRGEDTRHQFKANVTNAAALASELVAMSNTAGGVIIIGVDDDNTVRGLSSDDVHRLNQLISSAASQNVRPPITVQTSNIEHPKGLVVVITVADGLSKPYLDDQGAFWVKNGADKRRVTGREELQRMFQDVGLVHADAAPVAGTGISELARDYFSDFFQREYGTEIESQSVPLPQLLDNMNLANNGNLNLAGTLLFATRPQSRLPAFIVKAAAFPGTDMAAEHYIDSRDIVGRLADVHQQCLSFLAANTTRRQGEQGVNSTGQPEIPLIVWEELIANALVHRNYYVIAPVRLLVFADRIEIISPGHLPNNLTIANIKAGNSNIRNPILASFAAKILPYRGLGSGILRALRAYPAIEFVDDRIGNLFHVIVARPAAQD